VNRRAEFERGQLPKFEDAYYSEATVHNLPVELVSRYADPSSSPNARKVSGIARGLKAGQPIREPLHIVDAGGGKAFLWDGHHRLLAAKKAGLTHVPVRVTL
jgi:ParB-like nuclease domain